MVQIKKTREKLNCSTPKWVHELWHISQGHTAQQEGQAMDTGSTGLPFRCPAPRAPGWTVAQAPHTQQAGGAQSQQPRIRKEGWDYSRSCSATRQKLQPGYSALRERERDCPSRWQRGPTQLSPVGSLLEAHVRLCGASWEERLSRDVTQRDV